MRRAHLAAVEEAEEMRRRRIAVVVWFTSSSSCCTCTRRQRSCFVVIVVSGDVEGGGHESEEPVDGDSRPHLHERLQHSPGDLVLEQHDVPRDGVDAGVHLGPGHERVQLRRGVGVVGEHGHHELQQEAAVQEHHLRQGLVAHAIDRPVAGVALASGSRQREHLLTDCRLHLRLALARHHRHPTTKLLLGGSLGVFHGHELRRGTVMMMVRTYGHGDRGGDAHEVGSSRDAQQT